MAFIKPVVVFRSAMVCLLLSMYLDDENILLIPQSFIVKILIEFCQRTWNDAEPSRGTQLHLKFPTRVPPYIQSTSDVPNRNCVKKHLFRLWIGSLVDILQILTFEHYLNFTTFLILLLEDSSLNPNVFRVFISKFRSSYIYKKLTLQLSD